MKTSELAKDLRGLADGFWDKDYFVVDSGDFDLKEKQAEIEKAMRDAADKIEEQQRRLDVAGGALEKLNEVFEMTEYAYGKNIAQPALAEIRKDREEGEE